MATPYHATGLSQSESITRRQAVAESTIMPVGFGGEGRLSVRPIRLQSLAAETLRAGCSTVAASREQSNSIAALRLGGNWRLPSVIACSARCWQPTCLL